MATPEGWQELRLRDVLIDDRYACVGGPFGSDLTRSDYVLHGVPVLRGSNMPPRGIHLREAAFAFVTEAKAMQLARNLARPGDLVFTQRGTLGQVGRIRPSSPYPQFLLSQSQMKATVDSSRVDADFLVHWFQSATVLAWVASRTTGTGVPHINLAILRDFPVRLAPLPEQRWIAAILSSVDETIEKTEAVIAQLQVVKKAMMQKLLTRGMPGQHVRFKQTDVEWRLGRIAAGEHEFPESWSLVRLADVARLESGHTPSRKQPDYWDGDIPWVSLHDSRGLDGPSILETSQTIGPLGLANSSARLLPRDTVVFSRTATVGKCTVLGREMATSQDFANYVCGPRLNHRYLMHLLRNMQPEWKRLMAGSTHQTIYMPVFRDLQILLPTLEEQREIAAVADRLDERLASESYSVSRLRGVKEALSAALLSGDLRVAVEKASK